MPEAGWHPECDWAPEADWHAIELGPTTATRTHTSTKANAHEGPISQNITAES